MFVKKLRLSQRLIMSNLMLFLIAHPFATITDISYYPGFQKNLNTIKWLVNYLVKNNVIFVVHKWHNKVFFVAQYVAPEYLATVGFLRLKETVFAKLNSMDFKRPEIRKFVSYYTIKDFRKITKKVIRKMPLENEDGLKNHQDPIYQIVLKHLKILFLTINMRVLENERAEKKNINEISCHSLKQKREGRIFNILADLKTFLDQYGIDKQIGFEQHILLKKALELDHKYYQYKYCYNNLAHNGVHSSIIVRAMIAEKMQHIFDSEAYELKTNVAKKNPIFLDQRGDLDISALSSIRQIQNADDNLQCFYDDIADLAWANNFRKLTDKAKFFNNESLKEKAQSPLNDYYVEFTD